MTHEVRRVVCDGAAVAATVLVDGTVAATWTVARRDDRAGSDDAVVLTVQPLRPLTPADGAAVEAEGDRLLAFTHTDAGERDVRLLHV